MSETENTGRVYELGYLLIPTLADGEIPEAVEGIKSLLEKNGGAVFSEGTPEFIDLSYQMEHIVGSVRSKYTQAYFGWVKFEAEPHALEGIKKAVDAAKNIIRSILIKTEKDNTVLFKKPKEAPRRESADQGELPLEELDEVAVEEHEKLPELANEIAAEPEVAPAA
ncbi:MAG TPA: 30S ribosomal protein S6, partial [Candidatus Paceibacterota bacterium]|nr:30S ribosomal protein S6 [Candidatus Paceibacterota bacterium]